MPVGNLGKSGLGMLGVIPAGLGILPGVDRGILGALGLLLGNWMLLPGLAVGLPIVGSIGFILEAGEEFVGLVGSLAGGVDPLDGIPVSGGVVLAPVAAGFFLTTPVVLVFLRVARNFAFFFLRLRLVWTATVLT